MVHQSFDQDIDFFARKCIWVNGPVITGAGPSGLAVGAGLKEQGVPFIVLKRAYCIASLWKKRTYDRLKLHLPKQFSQLPNFPFPEDLPEYPTKNQFINYPESYAQHFDISPNCSETVQSAKYDETFGHWRVKTSISTSDSNPSAFAEVEYVCRWLVVATGENSEKVVPEFEALEEFKGNVVHACDYKSGLAYRGKQVLVVGCGNSGMEVCLDLCNHNASPSMVVRSSVHVLPREIFGKSTFELAVLLMKWLPLWLADKILLMLPWLLFGNLEKYGLKRPSLGPLELKNISGKTPVSDIGAFKKVLVLDDPEYVHCSAKTIDLTSLQNKRFMLLKKTSFSNSANQHKCPAHSQGCKIFSSSCNALPIVTDDIAITKRILWLPINHGARVSQKDKLGLTYFFVILLLGWIPGVNAAGENALLQGCTCTWICIIIGTIALVYFANKIYSLPPPEPYLFSEKVRIWINGEMIVVELYDDEGILVGSWRCALFTANGNAVDFTEWVTNLFNFVLHIFVQQEDGVEEISFNQMDDPEFIGMPMDVYLHNPDTGRLRYIGRSVPQNGAPSERDIIILMESITYDLVQQFLM